MAFDNKYEIDEEIVAVISAVVAEMDTRPGYRLAVKSMKRTQTTPVWNMTGRLERMGRNLNS